MRPAESASETLFSTAIVFVVGGLRQSTKLRFAQRRHPSCRDVPIHQAAALAIALRPGPDRSLLTRPACFPSFFATNLDYTPVGRIPGFFRLPFRRGKCLLLSHGG
jgi:hypothetical protein